VDSNSEIQGYNVYLMLHFHRKFSSGVIVSAAFSKLTFSLSSSTAITVFPMVLDCQSSMKNCSRTRSHIVSSV